MIILKFSEKRMHEDECYTIESFMKVLRHYFNKLKFKVNLYYNGREFLFGVIFAFWGVKVIFLVGREGGGGIKIQN